MGTQVVLEVHNTWTSIQNPNPHALDLIDNETKYPTQTALAIQQGFRPPDTNPCAACGATGRDSTTGWGCQRCGGTGQTSGWDGWVRLLHRTKTKAPYFPTGLLYRAVGALQHVGMPFHVRDLRERPAEGLWDAGVKIALRDYQEEAVAAAVQAGLGVLNMVPRAGKTRCGIELTRRLGLPVIWMAPTDQIVQQTQNAIEALLGRNMVVRQIGVQNLERAIHANIVICTSATGAMLPEEFWKSRQVWIVDEIHHGAAKSFHKMAERADHIYHRFGMTGTFFRSGPDLLALHALMSEEVYRVTSDDLLRRGYLVPTKVVFLPVLSGPLKGIPRDATYQVGIGKHGIQEHEYRQQLAANCAGYLEQLGRRVLCLVATKRQGRDLRERIAQLIVKAPAGAQFNAVEFVSTDTDRPILGKILDSFINHQEVRVLIGTSLLGEGVDLPGADALVYARGEKAEVSLTQNAYRVCTALPGKGAAIIVDFADRHHKKLLEHSKERLAVYHDEPIFSVEVLRDPQDFTFWAQQAGLIRL